MLKYEPIIWFATYRGSCEPNLTRGLSPCDRDRVIMTPSNSSLLGRVDANITLRSLVRHFFSCHTLIIQFRRRKCKAEMRLFSIQTQFFYFWGYFSIQIGRRCAVSHLRPSCIIVSIAIAVHFPTHEENPSH